MQRRLTSGTPSSRVPRVALLAISMAGVAWVLSTDAALAEQAARFLSEARYPLMVVLTAGLLYLVLRGTHSGSAQVAHIARDCEWRTDRDFAANPRPVWIFDQETFYFLAVNDAACREYGYSAAEFRRMRITQMHPPADIEALRAALVNTEFEFARQWHHVRKEGTVRLVEIVSTPLRFAGRPARMAVITDVTGQVRGEEQARLAAMALADVAEAVAILNAEGRLLNVNTAFERLTRFSACEVMGRSARYFIKGDAERFLRMLAVIGNASGEVWCRRKGSAPFIVELSVRAARGADGKVSHYVAVARDLSAERAAEGNIHELTHYDRLTGLPNRTLLDGRARQAIASHERRREQFALLFVDLDNFEAVNKSLGHVAGDAVLQAAARRIAGVVPVADTFARWAGDEFVVLLPSADSVTAERIAQHILEALEAPANVGGQPVALGASVGISMYPEDGADFETLLNSADTAMRNAKKRGRNTWQLYSVPRDGDPAEGFALTGALHQALNNGNELEVHYQPQIDLGTGMVAGFEALARWKNTHLGYVPPSKFIRVAESSGYIAELGNWVLAQACRDLHALAGAGFGHARMAVNISAMQLHDPNFVDRCLRIVDKCGVRPDQLELEMTESMLVQDRNSVIRQLARLREQGVRIAIDDFGTGFSNLSYLQHLPVDTIKIDISLVREMAIDANAYSIVRAIIGLAHSLHFQCAAEGVETRGQRSLLSRLRCDRAQGYLYARPLPAPLLRDWLRTRGRAANERRGPVLIVVPTTAEVDAVPAGAPQRPARAIPRVV